MKKIIKIAGVSLVILSIISITTILIITKRANNKQVVKAEQQIEKINKNKQLNSRI